MLEAKTLLDLYHLDWLEGARLTQQHKREKNMGPYRKSRLKAYRGFFSEAEASTTRWFAIVAQS